MSNSKDYMFENAKKCIEAYGEQRWQFLEVWAAADKDYHGLPCEKLKNPAVSFTEQAKSGKFDGISDEHYELPPPCSDYVVCSYGGGICSAVTK